MRGVTNALLISIAAYALPLAVWFAPHRWAVSGCMAAVLVAGWLLLRQWQEGTE